MKVNSLILLLVLCRFFSFGQTPSFTTEQYRQDFNYFWAGINEEYCYFNKKQTDWQKVKELYAPVIETITSREQFVTLLEKALYEIYDHHAVLNTNTPNSQRLVPSGTDIWAEYVAGKPIITELRRGFGTQACGIVPGMEVIAINDVPVESAVKKLLPRSLKVVDEEAKSFTLRILLAGNHSQPRKFTLKYKGGVKEYFPDQAGMLLEHIQHASKLESKVIDGFGYIIINDCLYDNDLIPAFDSVMEVLKNTKGLILDLRETPSGGNTSVAKGILGWFTDKEQFYQKHEYYADEKNTGIKRSWEEIVSPRKGKYTAKPLVILGNHWTGSIAEGIVMGFDALKRPRTTIIGTELARLNGAVYSYEMPNTKIHFTFPAERLYHINGLPREQYIPPVFIDWRKGEEKAGTDIFMEKALLYLKK